LGAATERRSVDPGANQPLRGPALGMGSRRLGLRWPRLELPARAGVGQTRVRSGVGQPCVLAVPGGRPAAPPPCSAHSTSSLRRPPPWPRRRTTSISCSATRGSSQNPRAWHPRRHWLSAAGVPGGRQKPDRPTPAPRATSRGGRFPPGRVTAPLSSASRDGCQLAPRPVRPHFGGQGKQLNGVARPDVQEHLAVGSDDPLPVEVAGQPPIHP
jgi:hypothetical protein